jgi:cytochrome c553
VRDLLPFAALLLLAGCSVADERAGAAFKASGALIALSGGDGGAANACFTCHGAEGQGDGQAVPRLAGLSAGYLEKQLADYGSALRPDEVMAPIAKRLDDSDRRAVSAYYAALSPRATAEATLSPPQLYTASCAVCHGENGEGVGPANPALAGQPPAYTREQIARFAQAERRNDPRGVMLASAAAVPPAEAEAIAIWLSTRSSARPPRHDAASLSASAAAARQWAASRAAHHRAQ